MKSFFIFLFRAAIVVLAIILLFAFFKDSSNPSESERSMNGLILTGVLVIGIGGIIWIKRR